MDHRRYSFPPSFRAGIRALATPSPSPARCEPMDPISRYCLVAPLLRRELDALRGRVGTPAECWGDRARLEAMSDRLAELLRVTFG